MTGSTRTIDAELPVLSCIFAPTMETPDHVAYAERLGYRRAWCYDSPSLYADPWMVLALAATRTTSIGLGAATLVPSLRHPLVNAAALATLAGLAPGRVSAAFGTGLTGRMLLGKRPLRWAEVAEYVAAVRGLLDGDVVQWDGRPITMLQPTGFVAPRPVAVDVLVAADGPKGAQVAEDFAATVISARIPRAPEGPRRVLLTFGTVLAAGEDVPDSRVRAAAEPALAAAYHARYEALGPDGVVDLPGGRQWRDLIETQAPERRHLTVHEGHLVATNEADAAFLPQAGHLLKSWTLTGSPAELRARLKAFAAAGVSEIAYQPMGSDIPRELRAFAAMAGPDAA